MMMELLNKKKILFGAFYSLVLSISLSMCLLFLSFGTQNKLSSIKNDIISYVLENEDSLQFTAFEKGKRIESFVDKDVLSSLEKSFYSCSTASRIFDEHFYLQIEYNNLVLRKDIALLESVERPHDGPNFILHGELQISCSETTKYDTCQTNYSFLSSQSDSLYLPDSFANDIVNFFSLSNIKEAIYSESNDGGFLSLINVKLKTTLDDSVEYDCKFRGAYKNNTKLAKNLSLIGGNEKPVAICSPDFFKNLTFSENKLYCLVKYNPNSTDAYYRFFSMLENELDSKNNEFDFNYNVNTKTADFFSSKLDSFGSKFYNQRQWLFVIIYCLTIILSVMLPLFFLKKSEFNSVWVVIFSFVFFLILVLTLSKINLGLFIVLTRKSLFFTVPFFLLHILTIISMLSKNRQKTYNDFFLVYKKIDV